MFQFFSHKSLYDHHHSDVQHSVQYTPGLTKILHTGRKKDPSPSPHPQSNDEIDPENVQQDVRLVEEGPMKEDDVEMPQMGIRTTFALLAILTVVRRWLSLP